MKHVNLINQFHFVEKLKRVKLFLILQLYWHSMTIMTT